MLLIDFDRPIKCKSTVSGWITEYVDTKEQVGCVFNKVTDLWRWQREQRELFNAAISRTV